jgi:hypothetical protein
MTYGVMPIDLSAALRADRPLLDYHWLVVPDQSALLTLLWGRRGEDRHGITGALVAEQIDGWCTDIWLFVPGQKPDLWVPGQLHPNGAMFAADDSGTLYGWHICRPEVIYGCGMEGDHRSKFELPLILETPLAPRMQPGTLNVAVDMVDPDGGSEQRWRNLAVEESRYRDQNATGRPVPNPWRFWPGPDEGRLAGFVRQHSGSGLAQRFDIGHWQALQRSMGRHQSMG